jgi:hypothetical protein
MIGAIGGRKLEQVVLEILSRCPGASKIRATVYNDLLAELSFSNDWSECSRIEKVNMLKS